ILTGETPPRSVFGTNLRARRIKVLADRAGIGVGVGTGCIPLRLYRAAAKPPTIHPAARRFASTPSDHAEPLASSHDRGRSGRLERRPLQSPGFLPVRPAGQGWPARLPGGGSQPYATQRTGPCAVESP